MSSVNLSGVSRVISARSLDLLIHEGLENSIALGLPALLCQVGMQHERVISLSRGTVHRKREVLDSSPFSKHRGVILWHPRFFPSSSASFLRLSDLRHLLCCCFYWCLTISSGSKCLGVWLLERMRGKLSEVLLGKVTDSRKDHFGFSVLPTTKKVPRKNTEEMSWRN